jgi:hypothetical protein
VFWFYELYSEQGANARWIIRPEGMDGIEYDGAPRPMLIAYSVLTEKVEGAVPFDKKVAMDDKLHCFVFAKGEGSVAAVWVWGDEKKKIGLALSREPRLLVSDMMGNPIHTDPGEKTVLHVDGNPLYLEAASVSARELFDYRSRIGLKR